MPEKKQTGSVTPSQENNQKVPSGIASLFVFLGCMSLIIGINAMSEAKSAFHQQTGMLLFLLCAVLWVGGFGIYEVRKVLYKIGEKEKGGK